MSKFKNPFSKKPPEQEAENDITSPVANDTANISPIATNNSGAAWNFIAMLSLVITAPFILVFSILTGRIRNPIVVCAFLLSIIGGFYYLSKNHNISKREIKTKIVQQMLDELTPEEKKEMREDFSSLREEIDEEEVPAPLYPLLDVPMDMLSINYLVFMLKSGYVADDGQGAEFILDSYLHSKHPKLREKSWEALHNIKSVEALRVMNNYTEEIKREAEARKKRDGNKVRKKGIVEGVEDSIGSELRSIRNKSGL